MPCVQRNVPFAQPLLHRLAADGVYLLHPCLQVGCVVEQRPVEFQLEVTGCAEATVMRQADFLGNAETDLECSLVSSWCVKKSI
jgi:hypothetical protein